MDVRVQFQICSHNTSTQLYEDVQTNTSGESVMSSVCLALRDLSDQCFGFLTGCFLFDDVVGMKKLHFEEVINFLLKSAMGDLQKMQFLNVV